MSDDGIEEMRIEAVRRFNRFWTRRIGVLREGLLHTPYTLTEARVLLEISHRGSPAATDLSRELGLDPGYLSRLLGRLESRGLVTRVPSEVDGRRRLLSLTPDGEEAFSLLDSRSREEVGEMLGGLPEGEQRRLLEAMRAVEAILEGDAARGFKYSEPFICVSPSPGIWAGSCKVTASSMPGSTAGTRASRRSSRGSWRTSSTVTMRRGSVAGSPRWTAKTSAASS